MASKKLEELSQLADQASAVANANDKDWQAAQQYGITKESLQLRHPELIREERELDHKIQSSVSKSRWLIGGSAVVGAAIPLALKKPTNKVWRAAVTVVTGLAGAAAGVAGSLALFVKPVAAKAMEAGDMENKALEQDIGSAVVNAPAAVQPGKEFAATLTPRDASHTAQVEIDAALPQQAGVGK